MSYSRRRNSLGWNQSTNRNQLITMTNRLRQKLQPKTVFNTFGVSVSLQPLRAPWKLQSEKHTAWHCWNMKPTRYAWHCMATPMSELDVVWTFDVCRLFRSASNRWCSICAETEQDCWVRSLTRMQQTTEPTSKPKLSNCAFGELCSIWIDSWTWRKSANLAISELADSSRGLSW